METQLLTFDVLSPELHGGQENEQVLHVYGRSLGKVASCFLSARSSVHRGPKTSTKDFCAVHGTRELPTNHPTGEGSPSLS